MRHPRSFASWPPEECGEPEAVPTGSSAPHGTRAALVAQLRQAVTGLVRPDAGQISVAGFDLELTRTIAEAVPVPVIASGGAGTISHFAEVLTEGKADAALAASLFHDGKLKIADLKNELNQQNIPVRLTLVES